MAISWLHLTGLAVFMCLGIQASDHSSAYQGLIPPPRDSFTGPCLPFEHGDSVLPVRQISRSDIAIMQAGLEYLRVQSRFWNRTAGEGAPIALAPEIEPERNAVVAVYDESLLAMLVAKGYADRVCSLMGEPRCEESDSTSYVMFGIPKYPEPEQAAVVVRSTVFNPAPYPCSTTTGRLRLRQVEAGWKVFREDPMWIPLKRSGSEDSQ